MTLKSRLEQSRLLYMKRITERNTGWKERHTNLFTRAQQNVSRAMTLIGMSVRMFATLGPILEHKLS